MARVGVSIFIAKRFSLDMPSSSKKNSNNLRLKPHELDQFKYLHDDRTGFIHLPRVLDSVGNAILSDQFTENRSSTHRCCMIIVVFHAAIAESKLPPSFVSLVLPSTLNSYSNVLAVVPEGLALHGAAPTPREMITPPTNSTFSAFML
jgi:hypothetical protein